MSDDEKIVLWGQGMPAPASMEISVTASYGACQEGHCDGRQVATAHRRAGASVVTRHIWNKSPTW